MPTQLCGANFQLNVSQNFHSLLENPVLLYMSKQKMQSVLPPDLQVIQPSQLQKEWQLSPVTLWRLEKSKKLVPVRIGRRKFYRFDDLRKFMAESTAATIKSSIS
ncbi:MAG: helix-turn-helix domain-containing protein [Verrucomicrobiia bacterium]|jgi:hypothetical protein